MINYTSNNEDPILEFFEKTLVIQPVIISAKMRERENSYNELTKLIYELKENIDEQMWIEKAIEFIINKATVERAQSKDPKAFVTPTYLPCPGQEDADIIKHPDYKSTKSIEVINATEEAHCREVAWVSKATYNNKKFIGILNFDPTQTVYVSNNKKLFAQSINFWKKQARIQKIISEEEELIVHPIFYNYTTFHQWEEALLNQPRQWRQFPLPRHMTSFCENQGVDIFAGSSLQLYAWKPSGSKDEIVTKKQDIQEEFNRPVAYSTKVFKRVGETSYRRPTKETITTRNLSGIESLAKAFWDETIKTAYDEGASDIHIIPQNSIGCEINETVVKIRHNGDLLFWKKISKDLTKYFLFYAVEGSSIPINEIKNPTDGRKTWKDPETKHEIDMRISVTPTSSDFPQVVMRLLDSNKLKSGVDQLGLGPEITNILTKAAKLQQGLILVSGPTGSGKSSTLYALLQSIRKFDKKRAISTIEDPIEYRLDFAACQTEIKEDMNYKTVIRQLMRNDPDSIMVGEIRDKETCDAALEVALTGHQVIASIHANSALETITRVKEFGSEDFVVREALKVVAAQRLVGTPCPICSVYTNTHPNIPKGAPVLSEEEFYKTYVNTIVDNMINTESELFQKKYPDLSQNGCFVYKVGCPACKHTGLAGRCAVQEALIIKEENKKLLESNKLDQLKEIAVANGFRTIEQNTWELAWRGIIPLNEAYSKINLFENE